MITVNALSEVAALMGDPARAAMLQLMMDGRAHTASDLAHVAGVTAQTASGHLARMVEANLLAARAQGRNRFYRLASSDVAHAIESLMAIEAGGSAHLAGPDGLCAIERGRSVVRFRFITSDRRSRLYEVETPRVDAAVAMLSAGLSYASLS